MFAKLERNYSLSKTEYIINNKNVTMSDFYAFSYMQDDKYSVWWSMYDKSFISSEGSYF
jgi:hypothetical protein